MTTANARAQASPALATVTEIFLTSEQPYPYIVYSNPNPQRTADRRTIWREHNQPKGSTLYRISYDGAKPRAAHFI